MSKKIKLSTGESATVDNKDYDWLSPLDWYVRKDENDNSHATADIDGKPVLMEYLVAARGKAEKAAKRNKKILLVEVNGIMIAKDIYETGQELAALYIPVQWI